MAMRAAATATAATAAATSGRGLRAMFSSLSSFPFNIPQTNVEKPPPAEPSTNLFVSDSTAHIAAARSLHVLGKRMAWRTAMLKTVGVKAGCALLSMRRWAHAMAKPPPLGTDITHLISPTSPPLVFPENIYDNFQRGAEELPNLPFFAGSIELMAVPKKKVSRHKKGIRNGPKALKPVPVIVRCKVCGRVKLPHFFCCSGIKPSPGDQCE